MTAGSVTSKIFSPEPDLQDLYAVGDYLFLATDGLDVYDLAEPSEPQLVWQQTEADVTALAVEGERLYLLSETELTVFGLRQPVVRLGPPQQRHHGFRPGDFQPGRSCSAAIAWLLAGFVSSDRCRGRAGVPGGIW